VAQRRAGRVLLDVRAARRQDASELKPDEPRYLAALLESLYEIERRKPRAERNVDALRAPLTQLRRIAGSASQLNEVGWLYGELKQPDLGLPSAKRAVELDPRCWQCLDTLARLYADMGFFEEALPLERRAANLMPEYASAATVLTRLARYEEAVKALPPAPPPSPPPPPPSEK
jgi:tetratricopeptide (TPR) repeat protein